MRKVRHRTLPLIIGHYEGGMRVVVFTRMALTLGANTRIHNVFRGTESTFVATSFEMLGGN